MAHDIFISHSHADKVFADAICHSVEANGVRCWVAPRDIRPSDDWAEAIINAMDTARILVLIFSAHSNTSPQVRREIERAVSKGLHVLTFRIENVPLSKSLEYFISSQHWLDAVEGELDPHLGQLNECIALLLSYRADQAPAAAAPTIKRAAPAPVATPAAPVVAQAAVADTVLAHIESQLALVVGPIARHLVRRYSAGASNADALIATLSHEIDDPKERAQFVKRCAAVPALS